MTENAAAPDPTPSDSAEELPLLVLASQSPGRARVLREAGIAFEAIVSEVDEDAVVAEAEAKYGEHSAADTALLLARAKAEAVAALDAADGAVVLGCDSVFELDGVAYGKPYTADVATERWKQMRGRTGVLHTGHWLIDNRAGDEVLDADPSSREDQDDDGGTGATLGTVTSASVTFAHADDDEIAAYVATGEPLPCAGAFTIDGRGAAFIERIEGDPHTVVGLSVSTLRALLEPANLAITDLWE